MNTIQPGDIAPSEITPREVYLNRRAWITGALAAGAVTALPQARAAVVSEAPLQFARNPKYTVDAKTTPFKDVTHYNNFYEFGTGKQDPAENAHTLRTHPWSITIAGEAGITGTYALDALLKQHPLEERVYRMRCVEAWSMVIPWVGFPLSALLKQFKPKPTAKYVAFTTLYAPKQMPGQRSSILPWPYVEGLRMDEAMHPLTLLAVGMFGRPMPKQDGAPIRLVVPWKYGFKGIKSIVKIEFTERQPVTTWNRAWPQAYGFYANVNPHVPHPRWSQATERVIGGGFFSRKPTLMFNGYEKEVAHLYKGMDLHKYY